MNNLYSNNIQQKIAKSFSKTKNSSINFNHQNISRIKKNSSKYNINFSSSLKDEILSPDNEDISYKEKDIYNYNNNYSISSINDSDININSLKNIKNKKTLILDLDETLVHSSFKPININNIFYSPDIYLNINFHNNIHKVYVLKRPNVDLFLEEMNKIFNIIIFTASVKEYANPLLDILDTKKIIKKRFFREHCVFNEGKYIKNLEIIGLDLKDLIIIDNNPISYSRNKKNGLPIKSWYYDKTDTELLKLINILNFLANVDDVRDYIPNIINNNNVHFRRINSNIKELNNNYEQNKFLKPKAKSQSKYFYFENNKNNLNNRNEIKKAYDYKMESNKREDYLYYNDNNNHNYNDINYKTNNNIKDNNMKKELKDKIQISLVQFKKQIELLQKKYNNIQIVKNDIKAKEKKILKELNFDYYTPQIKNKYKNKFTDNKENLNQNNYHHRKINKFKNINRIKYNTYENYIFNENEKNNNIYNDINIYDSSYKISKNTNDYIKKRMNFTKENIIKEIKNELSDEDELYVSYKNLLYI